MNNVERCVKCASYPITVLMALRISRWRRRGCFKTSYAPKFPVNNLTHQLSMCFHGWYCRWFISGWNGTRSTTLSIRNVDFAETCAALSLTKEHHKEDSYQNQSLQLAIIARCRRHCCWWPRSDASTINSTQSQPSPPALSSDQTVDRPRSHSWGKRFVILQLWCSIYTSLQAPLVLIIIHKSTDTV